MKKATVLLIALLALAGCASRAERAERAYAEANAACSMSQDYAACMNYHAVQYQAEQQRRAASAAAWSAFGASMNNLQRQQQPAPRLRTTCTQNGVFLNCF